jgi:hypothetical protein
MGDHHHWPRARREIKMLKELRFPHSLGLLYSAFTDYCGFRINSGEYKLMGLAPYGEPKYADAIRRELLDLKPDGSFRLNLDYFNFLRGTTMTNEKFHKLFGGPPRGPEEKIDNGTWTWRVPSNGHGRNHAAARAPRPRSDRPEKSLPGRRRGAQLRRERNYSREKIFENGSGSNRPRAMRAARSARRWRRGMRKGKFARKTGSIDSMQGVAARPGIFR